MNFAAWLLIGYFVLNIIVGAYRIGRPVKPRDPVTPGVAAGTILFLIAMYTGLTVILLIAVGVLPE